MPSSFPRLSAHTLEASEDTMRQGQAGDEDKEGRRREERMGKGQKAHEDKEVMGGKKEELRMRAAEEECMFIVLAKYGHIPSQAPVFALLF